MVESGQLGDLRIERALVAFDTETTGTDVTFDRVVEIALLRQEPDGSICEYRRLVNPGTPIPMEASRVHGITDAMVTDAPAFKHIAPELLELFQGSDLVGFNLLRFDVPLLKNEFQRAGLRWDLEGTRILDAQTIFHRMEPRDLTAAYRFYCGKELQGAHGALADARATLEVLGAQITRYRDLPREVAGLDALFNLPDQRFVDSERRFRWRNGEPSFNFGNHRGEMLRDVAQKDPAYLEWILHKDFSSEVKDIVRHAIAGIIPKQGNLFGEEVEG